MMENEIKHFLERLSDQVSSLENKVDGIISRNARADSDIAVIKERVLNHSHDDDRRFGAIDKKHDIYDKFVIGVLVFGIAELVVVVMVLIK